MTTSSLGVPLGKSLLVPFDCIVLGSGMLSQVTLSEVNFQFVVSEAIVGDREDVVVLDFLLEIAVEHLQEYIPIVEI